MSVTFFVYSPICCCDGEMLNVVNLEKFEALDNQKPSSELPNRGVIKLHKLARIRIHPALIS